ncbi:hypothetical protein [Pseudarthrobacter phenanthrenivorans]|uniref:hypothetical protein n=1 Tax=Pseudarthrobacter phenanthrenivorans TaxID=361575 RepID=UPI0015E867FB|nr:hypothetical protein [Pseudarthrobacter phenanthrenivorans]
MAAVAALLGALLGSQMQSASTREAALIQVQAQERKDGIERLGAASSRFLLATDGIYNIADLPRQAPPWAKAISTAEAADVDLFIYGTPELYELGNQLMDILLPDGGTATTGTVDLDQGAYDQAREAFVREVRKEVR